MPVVAVLVTTVLGSFTVSIASRAASFEPSPVVVPPLETEGTTLTVTVFAVSRSSTESVPLVVKPALVSVSVAVAVSPWRRVIAGMEPSPHRSNCRWPKLPPVLKVRTS